MRKIIQTLVIGVSLVAVIVGMFFFCSVSIPGKRPSEGVWYCDELHLSIDFTQMETDSKCVKLYNADETFIELICNTDFGNGIYIEYINDTDPSDYEIHHFLVGTFHYIGDTFYIHSDGKWYSFCKI